jgi:hypothetical protein
VRGRACAGARARQRRSRLVARGACGARAHPLWRAAEARARAHAALQRERGAGSRRGALAARVARVARIPLHGRGGCGARVPGRHSRAPRLALWAHRAQRGRRWHASTAWPTACSESR